MHGSSVRVLHINPALRPWCFAAVRRTSNTVPSQWAAAEPANCATKCGSPEGSGTAGAVTCSGGEGTRRFRVRRDLGESDGEGETSAEATGEGEGQGEGETSAEEGRGEGEASEAANTPDAGCPAEDKPAAKICPATQQCRWVHTNARKYRGCTEGNYVCESGDAKDCNAATRPAEKNGCPLKRLGCFEVKSVGFTELQELKGVAKNECRRRTLQAGRFVFGHKERTCYLIPVNWAGLVPIKLTDELDAECKELTVFEAKNAFVPADVEDQDWEACSANKGTCRCTGTVIIMRDGDSGPTTPADLVGDTTGSMYRAKFSVGQIACSSGTFQSDVNPGGKKHCYCGTSKKAYTTEAPQPPPTPTAPPAPPIKFRKMVVNNGNSGRCVPEVAASYWERMGVPSDEECQQQCVCKALEPDCPSKDVCAKYTFNAKTGHCKLYKEGHKAGMYVQWHIDKNVNSKMWQCRERCRNTKGCTAPLPPTAVRHLEPDFLFNGRVSVII